MYSQEGHIIWHEVLSDKLDDTTAFYTAVVGWSHSDTAVGGTTYRMLRAADTPVAAVIADAGEGLGPGWVSYVGVDDIDKMLERVSHLGGTVVEGPVDAKSIGRFAIIRDPRGALVGLFSPSADNRSRDEPGQPTIGRFGWHELYTDDPDAAFEFYARAFGWERGQAFDMGPAGSYQLYTLGGRPAGGMMRMNASVSRPQWNPFVQVAGIETAESRIITAGGRVFDKLRETPSGDWTLKGIDRDGAFFALSGRRDRTMAVGGI